MRRLGTFLGAVGLAAAGVVLPATAAHAGPGCDAKWPGRDGYVRAWDGYDCQGTLLGATVGDDAHWGDGEGAFTWDKMDRASSVMNSGYYGGRDVVAFYYMEYHDYERGYACLAPGELYVDDLSRNRFHNQVEGSVDNNIRSHRWVTASECAAGSWMS
ncbi:hypothetical protein ACIF8T_37985 [Streptomyces sp. NPDC085946]|uniref:hypothetical protein n=1 Tax=Streptomyces sp. NPDC085946 TaxID=3365744 RepID=UPI0037D2442F